MNANSRQSGFSWLIMLLAFPVCLLVLASCETLPVSRQKPNESIEQTSPEPSTERTYALDRSAFEADLSEISQLYTIYEQSVRDRLITPLEKIGKQSVNGRTVNFLKYEIDLDIPQVQDNLRLLERALDRFGERLSLLKSDQENNKQIAETKEILAKADESIALVNDKIIAPLSPSPIQTEDIFKAESDAGSSYREVSLRLSDISTYLESIEENLQAIKSKTIAPAARVESPQPTATSQLTTAGETTPVASSPNTANLEKEFAGIEQATTQIRQATMGGWRQNTTVYISSISDEALTNRLTENEQKQAITKLQSDLPTYSSSPSGLYDPATFTAIEQFLNQQNEVLAQSISSLSTDELPSDPPLRLWTLLTFVGLLIAIVIGSGILFSRKRIATMPGFANDDVKRENERLRQENAALQEENKKLSQAFRLPSRKMLPTKDMPTLPALSVTSVPENRSPELDSIIEAVGKDSTISEIDVIKVYNTDYERLNQFVTAVEHSDDSIKSYFSEARSGPMLLEAKKGGKYWVIQSQPVEQEGDRSYFLLLRKDTHSAKINQNNVRAIQAFFSLDNQHILRSEFELIVPAIVEKLEKKGIDQWQLKRAGRIRFRENSEAD